MPHSGGRTWKTFKSAMVGLCGLALTCSAFQVPCLSSGPWGQELGLLGLYVWLSLIPPRLVSKQGSMAEGHLGTSVPGLWRSVNQAGPLWTLMGFSLGVVCLFASSDHLHCRMGEKFFSASQHNPCMRMCPYWGTHVEFRR